MAECVSVEEKGNYPTLICDWIKLFLILSRLKWYNSMVSIFEWNNSGAEILSYLEVLYDMWRVCGCSSVECYSFSCTIITGAGDRLAQKLSLYVWS